MDFGEIRDNVTGFLYRSILKPIFFLQDPEVVHDGMTEAGEALGKYKISRSLTLLMFGYKNKMLEQTVAGIFFQNPIGLAAGFDKDARLTQILPEVGFGFEEVGSITAKAYQGNPKPRLYRLPEKNSLRVNYGLKNLGAERIHDKLKNIFASANPELPPTPSLNKEGERMVLGISIAKTNNEYTSHLGSGAEDYFFTYKLFQNVGDYFTINISCPNTCEVRPIFAEPENLNKLLQKLFSIPKTKPVFIKLSPDLPESQLMEILAVCGNHPVDGFVCGNLTKENSFDHEGKGGFSGKAVWELSNKLIATVYKYYHGQKTVIGCGGVFSAEDAYQKIRLGSSLIQLITGMIFQGPELIGEINRGLVELLKRDGLHNIAEAVGADNKI